MLNLNRIHNGASNIAILINQLNMKRFVRINHHPFHHGMNAEMAENGSNFDATVLSIGTIHTQVRKISKKNHLRGIAADPR